MKPFLIAICILMVHQVNARRIEVCATCEISTLEQAIVAADTHDVIYVQAGDYTVSEVIIEKPLTIDGDSNAWLDGGGNTILYVHADDVAIKNVSFRNVSTNYVEDKAAIKCNNSDNLIIDNVRIRHSFFGILVEKSKNGRVVNCDVRGDATTDTYLESSNGNAIHLWYCKNMLIEDNEVRAHRDGIYFEFVEKSVIQNNWSEANMRYGLHFMFSHENLYKSNTFIKNGSGVAVMYSTKVTMISNQFLDNWGGSAYGLLLKDITDSELNQNVFYNNTIAISADNTMRCRVHNNWFQRNGYGLRIMGSCNDNVFEQNDFVENSFDVTTNASTNYNSFDGNYWEEYTGYDLDKDGIGDVPFRPVKLFTYILSQSPAAIILMRSSFIDLLNLAEKVTPVLTPESLVDLKPSMNPINDQLKRGR